MKNDYDKVELDANFNKNEYKTTKIGRNAEIKENTTVKGTERLKWRLRETITFII